MNNDLNIDVSYNDYYKEILKGTTKEERKQIFMRCYVVNVTEKELQSWTLKDLITYIYETNFYWNDDLEDTKRCYLLCNQGIKDDFYNEFSNWKSIFE